MMKGTAKIEYSSLQSSCFVVVSWPVSSSGSIKILELRSENGEQHYVTISGSGGNVGRNSGSHNAIKINAKFAKALKLKDGDLVHFSEVGSVPVTVTSAKVSCCSPDDWEILETNAEMVANQLLNQIRVVYPRQEFPFWLSKSMTIHLKIDELSPPAEFGILATNTDIIIPSLASVKCPIPLKLRQHSKLRIHSFSIPHSINLLPTDALLFSNVYHGFTYKSHLRLNEDANKLDSIDLDSIDVQIMGYNEESQKPIALRLLIIDSMNSKIAKDFLPFVNVPCLYLHPEFSTLNNLTNKSWVWLSALPENQDPPISIKSIGKTPLPKTSDSGGDIPIYCGFQNTITECANFIKAALSLNQTDSPYQNDFPECETGSLLIHGASGSGKTSLVHAVVESLSIMPYYVHWELISCAKLRGKKAENVEKELVSVLKSLESKQPSILILDDLDVLTPASKPDEQSSQENFVYLKLSETVLETVLKYKTFRLAVVCTAISKSSLNVYWKSRSGFHFFQKYVKLMSPTKSERLEIFEACLKQTAFGNVPEGSCKRSEIMEQIAVSLGAIHDHDATPQFLVNISKRWRAYLQSHDQDLIHLMEGFNDILEEEIKFSGNSDESRGRNAIKKVSWETVGGLTDIKQELKKILEWPLKFPQFFKNVPVRLPCGILFYGYPGTGKTLLGLSIQSIVNVKFIHVKGPELLSKYIGASEQAVQDVFARARESRPCILFFDEFDSLVPRRGHDSSGVTDRVVNQFLSEMDGIEGGLGESVYLIAATSRPDLIDPAVLRPGRLDKHLFFDLPSKRERQEILTTMGNLVGLKLQNESEMEEICEVTHGFTGADLNALLCSAQLAVVKEYLEKRNSESNAQCSSSAANKAKSGTSIEEIKVTQQDLLSCLKEFKPSVQGSEFKKFQSIYQGFSISKRSGANKSSPTDVENIDTPWKIVPGKRATLA
ncbi:unnamed protein product [Orchesella dallaii]|uniref:Peroxisomal ATPase PEX1 n=1 Tax=Orchesella dallaii TaxID=48710 RepID=A0ABP1QKP5_9HEXA